MKINFEKVLADYGLKVGDKVNIEVFTRNPCVINHTKYSGFYLLDRDDNEVSIQLLFNEWKKVEPKKKVGDLTCEEVANDMKKIKCSGCPLKCISCENGGPTLNNIAKETFKKYPQLEPMRAYIEKELNREIKE